MDEWFSVDELLPEDCRLCNFHSDSMMEFTSVLTMNKRGQMEIKNRLRVKKIGSPYLDEHATDGWVWSRGGIEPKYWFPIPKNKKCLEEERTKQ